MKTRIILFVLLPCLSFYLGFSQLGPNIAKYDLDEWWTLDNPPSVVISDGETIEIVAGENISITPGDSTITINENFYWRSKEEVEMLHLLELYERDCYNDSTFVQEWRIEFVRWDSLSPDVSTGHYEEFLYSKWEHREPTFTGFIKWLKDRK